jgi:outer membrane protein assembly factor BamB
MVYAADSSKLYALDETTGVQLWNTTWTMQGSVSGTPAYYDGEIFLGTTSGYLYSINATTGAEIQSYPVSPDTIQDSPVVANGIVYFGTTEGYLYALTTSTLSYLWRFAAGGAIYSSPTIYKTWIYFGCNDNNIYGLNSSGSTVSLKWRFSTNGTITSTATCANGKVYIGTSNTDHALLALNATSTSVKGQLIWKYVLTYAYAINPPAFATIGSTNFIYITTSEPSIQALYADVSPGIYQENDPTIRAWSETPGYSPTNPAVADGKVFFTTNDGYLNAMNATTGHTKWTYKFANGPYEPIVADGRIFDVNYYSGLTCFGLAYPPQTYYYSVHVSGQNFVIKLVINATPGQSIDTSTLLAKYDLGYGLQGISGNVGASNITIPNALLNASSPDAWIVTIDGAAPFTGPTVVNNGTYTSLYFTYLEGSSDKVVITGTSTVPEFPMVTIVPLVAAISLMAIVFAKKKIPKK